MPITATTPGDIAHLIQLAIAPVFLLTAVGTLLAVLTNRLGRAVDRHRVLGGARLAELDAATVAAAHGEIDSLNRRLRLIYAAITLAVVCALAICVLIGVAFVSAWIAFPLAKLIAACFVAAMLALIGSLTVFLREIFVAVTAPRCPVR